MLQRRRLSLSQTWATCSEAASPVTPPLVAPRPLPALPPWRSLGVVLQDAVSGFFSHQAQTRGAAIAYYTLFSLAPMLLVAIAVAGIAFGEEAARGEILRQLSALIGTTVLPPCRTCLPACSATDKADGVPSWALGCFWLAPPPSLPNCKLRSTRSGATPPWPRVVARLHPGARCCELGCSPSA